MCLPSFMCKHNTTLHFVKTHSMFSMSLPQYIVINIRKNGEVYIIDNICCRNVFKFLLKIQVILLTLLAILFM